MAFWWHHSFTIETNSTNWSHFRKFPVKSSCPIWWICIVPTHKVRALSADQQPLSWMEFNSVFCFGTVQQGGYLPTWHRKNLLKAFCHTGGHVRKKYSNPFMCYPLESKKHWCGYFADLQYSLNATEKQEFLAYITYCTFQLKLIIHRNNQYHSYLYIFCNSYQLLLIL